jgi:hypothetical protein
MREKSGVEFLEGDGRRKIFLEKKDGSAILRAFTK